MKRQRVPYARRTLQYYVVALAAVLVVACIIGGLEIYHLHNQINGLKSQVNTFEALLYKAAQSAK
jgi:hypothetical protein